MGILFTDIRDLDPDWINIKIGNQKLNEKMMNKLYKFFTIEIKRTVIKN